MGVEHPCGVAEVTGQILTIGAMAYDMVALIGADVEQRSRDGSAIAGKGEFAAVDAEEKFAIIASLCYCERSDAIQGGL